MARPRAPVPGCWPIWRRGRPSSPPATFYTVGSVEMVTVEQFNAILYLEDSPKMHPLAWPSCQ
ncbi:MAG TPA: hypothetical protein VGX68_09215 [Thermoanaerobaculia bacterium]|nr:hypothetical protein [Thermoanaerobaculia bacterium]